MLPRGHVFVMQEPLVYLCQRNTALEYIAGNCFTRVSWAFQKGEEGLEAPTCMRTPLMAELALVACKEG
jgi:hypothetical protein